MLKVKPVNVMIEYIGFLVRFLRAILIKLFISGNVSCSLFRVYRSVFIVLCFAFNIFLTTVPTAIGNTEF